MSTDADVLVIGCGPVGVMTALRAAQRGLRVVAIDRATEIFPLPRAIAMDEEIQDVYARAGRLDDLRAVSSPLLGAEFVDAAGDCLVGLELPPGTHGPLGHAPMVVFEQPPMEAFLRRAAVEAGVDLRLGWEGVSIDSTTSPVVVSVRDAAGSDTVLSARWLVGADGASSWVRRSLGVDFVDQGFDQEWLVIDATARREFPFPSVATQVCDPARTVTIIPGHGTRRRWEFKLLPGETRDEMQAEDRIWALLTPWAGPDDVELDRTAVYRFHATVAATFRVDDVFLAGDAAHQMPPFNGQGMCTGIRDAENLTWKLAAVEEGRCGPGLLDTYDIERRPFSAAQVEHSADAGRLIDALAAGHDVDTAAGYGGGRPFPRVVDGLVDGDHPLVGHPMPAVDGVVLGSRFVVLAETAPDDAVASWWRALGAAIVVAPQPDDRRGCSVVVRPDRLVAAVTPDLAATTVRLAGRLDVDPPMGA